MADNDKELGLRVHKHLAEAGKESPLSTDWIDTHICKPEDPNRMQYVQNHIQGAFEGIIHLLGLDANDPSIKDTPKRVAKMFCHEVFEGLSYDNFPKCTTTPNDMQYDEVVLVRNNVVRSTCEHHLQPIYGRAHIAYIPGKKVLGLSKFARVVDFFSSRPQVQERLTEQLYASLSFILETQDIAVVLEADHFCMKMRGVEEYCSDTVTSKMGGRFMSNPALRQEVMSLITERKF